MSGPLFGPGPGVVTPGTPPSRRPCMKCFVPTGPLISDSPFAFHIFLVCLSGYFFLSLGLHTLLVQGSVKEDSLPIINSTSSSMMIENVTLEKIWYNDPMILTLPPANLNHRI